MRVLTVLLVLGLSLSAVIAFERPKIPPPVLQNVVLTDDKIEKIVQFLLEKKQSYTDDDDEIDLERRGRCLLQLASMFLGILRRELWALEIFDSWAKLQSGFAMGNIRNMGHYDQCIRTYHNLEETELFGNLTSWQGQHCVLRLGGEDREVPEGESPNVGDIMNAIGLTLDFGLCVPKECEPVFVHEIFVALGPVLALNLGTDIGLMPTKESLDVQELLCHTTDRTPLSGFDISAIVTVSLLVAVVIASTSYDLVARQLRSNRNGLLVAFSLYTNGRKLFSLRKKPDDIRCLYGIRSLTIIWLMVGHRFFLTMLIFPMNAIEFVTSFTDGFFSPFVFSSQLGIDTLILLSGVILSFSFMRQMDKTGRVSVPRLFLHRYLKITPILMFAIYIFMTLVKYLGEGPYYDFLITANVEPCNDYWWSAFLYVQNYVNPTSVCLLQGWYLSVEMQLLWASPLFLFPLFFWGRKFSWVVIFFVLVSIALIFTYSFINEFMAFIILNPLDKLGDFVRLIFMPTHARMGPWFIGVFCGYILARMRDRKLVMNRILESVLWVIALAIPFTVIFLHHPFQQFFDNSTTVLQNSFYSAFHRNLFALSVAWIIFGCHNGSGSIINWILSRPIWQPLSRLSLCFYLTHIGLQITSIASQKTPAYFGNSELFSAANGDFVNGLILATFAHLAVQAPFMRIEKYFYKSTDAKDDEELKIKQFKWYERFT